MQATGNSVGSITDADLPLSRRKCVSWLGQNCWLRRCAADVFGKLSALICEEIAGILKTDARNAKDNTVALQQLDKAHKVRKSNKFPTRIRGDETGFALMTSVPWETTSEFYGRKATMSVLRSRASNNRVDVGHFRSRDEFKRIFHSKNHDSRWRPYYYSVGT